MWRRSETAGRICRFLEQGSGGPVFLWAFYPGEEELGDLETALRQTIPDGGYAVAAYPVEDWDRDLSPWEAPAAMGDGCFAGRGADTLQWLQESFLPRLREELPDRSRFYLTGYSLAGLFALWGLYEADCFQGAVCCSGSLWLDGWDEYAASHFVKAPSDVYLSLGGKEERTRNPRMARVGDCTRRQEVLLRRDPQVKNCVLEWNAGGHFADPMKRLAKGIAWIAGRSG